jgi:hypothetical protein
MGFGYSKVCTKILALLFFTTCKDHPRKVRPPSGMMMMSYRGGRVITRRARESLALLLAPNHRNPIANCNTLLKGHFRSVLQLLPPHKSTSTCSAACAKSTMKSSTCSKQDTEEQSRIRTEGYRHEPNSELDALRCCSP